ncbi:hypothetical protein ABBQ38_005075 [Trebouxia sp. C0009 RCD-2024]
MAVGALRAAGLAAAALGYHVWRLLTKQDSTADTEDYDQGLRSHPLGPEVELSSFSGNSSQAVGSSPRSCEVSPRMTPLPEQLEPADSSAFHQALNQWDAPVDTKQAEQVREYELSAMEHAEGNQNLSNSMRPTLYNQATTSSPIRQHAGTASIDQPGFHSPAGSHSSNQSEPRSALHHKLPSQEAALDEGFPAIRKITPVGSPEKETLHGGASFANPLPADQADASHDSQVPTKPFLDSHSAHKQEQPSISQPAADLPRPAAQRLARVNTVSRTASPDLAQTAGSSLQNGHFLDDHSDRKADSQSASTSAAANSALSQLLHSDTQASTGTPMARDLTEALTALASNKRLMSSMQASRSFSSPDLLSLAQHLHDSGQWTAVQDMVQQEEEELQSREAQSQASALSGHDNYGTVVGRPHMPAAEGQGPVSPPASPSLQDSHRNATSSLESLKRAREVLETPLALRLDVLAGPACNKSYTTDPGVTQVTVGRLEDNTLPVPDTEVSGHHVIIRWDPRERCWQVTDTGSLNGTFLNGKTISTNNRKQGREHRLSSDDMMQLGSYSKVRVSYFPMEMLDDDMPVHPKRVQTPPSSKNSSPNEDKTNSAAPMASSPDLGSRIHSDMLRLEGCAVSQTGREHQRRGQGCEDVIHWEVPLRSCGNCASLFCIFDGHCGRNSAREARELLPQILSDSLKQVGDSLQHGSGADSIWEQAFLSTDSRIKSEEGCTATALLVWKDLEDNVCLQAANVGDSAVVFSDATHLEGVQLTADHRLTNPDERQRLADMGIHLGQDRTRLYGLNLSRCLGDKFLKDEDLGLSAHPHVSEVIKVGPEQSGIIVMASDGLWDVTDSQRVLQIVGRVSKESNGSVQAMTDAVVQHAQRQRTRDDLSVVLLKVRALDSSFSFA